MDQPALGPEATVIPKGLMIGPLFMVTLRPEPGIDATKALRGALKTLLRTYGLRCTSISEYTETTNHDDADRLASRHSQDGCRNGAGRKTRPVATEDGGDTEIPLP
jgi:hypothetical protein